MSAQSGVRRLRARVRAHLEAIYGPTRARKLTTPVVEAMGYSGPIAEPEPYRNRWDEADCWVITYAGTIRQAGAPGLQTLTKFLETHLADSINGVHVLPYTSLEDLTSGNMLRGTPNSWRSSSSQSPSWML